MNAPSIRRIAILRIDGAFIHTHWIPVLRRLPDLIRMRVIFEIIDQRLTEIGVPNSIDPFFKRHSSEFVPFLRPDEEMERTQTNDV